ncbi:ferredoxin [Pseudonocardia asaccharolytica]|uniref:Ferredoxin n=1 Tax=Pseudonocardia asaccharolytica DSM 44247 = NBRC 16224 TaxID=1123024 RepID=A0A511CXG3_9PSEU|nr:ferredoxin [Pseudonocardia asaccharolytica]GEL17232.1 hypothetical protein PA7_10690 [Pseudonocardia asaccharolytica DSM 44247 = NBRC 16224]
MHVRIDQELCRGNGACVVAAPNVFDYDEGTDRGTVLMPDVPASEEANVRMAAMHCPTRALAVVEP